MLGAGLSEAKHLEDALTVGEAQLSMMKRLGGSEYDILTTQSNLAITYGRLGRDEEALLLRKEVYAGTLKQCGKEDKDTLISALNLSTSLVNSGKFTEARAFTHKQMELARRVLGADHSTTLDFQWGYSRAFTLDREVSAEQLAEAVAILEKTLKTAQRVLGREHPRTGNIRYALEECKKLVTAKVNTESS